MTDRLIAYARNLRNRSSVLRFWDNDVLIGAGKVLEAIRERCLEHPPLHPLPSREGK